MGIVNNIIENDLRYDHSTTVFPEPNSFNMHAHDVCEFYYFINGEAQYYVEGNVYSLKRGDIMIMRQGETHRLQIKKDCVYERMSFHFSPSFVLKGYSEKFLKPFYNRGLGRLNLYRSTDFKTNHYLSCINTMIRNIDENKSAEFITAPFLSLLIELYEAYENKVKSEASPEKVSVAIAMVEFINENIYEDLSLKKISDKFYLSSSQANRVFKKSIGSSIWEYVTVKRLILAKNMLSSGVCACEVASKCRFSDYSSFYRAYVKKFGNSPSKELKAKK